MWHVPHRISRWLLPTVLILFLLETVTFPIVISITYAGSGKSPEHILTYSKGSLMWDAQTQVDDDGVAELSLFEAVYNAVESENGDAVVAPGTENNAIVRLKNTVEGKISYTAVMYAIKEAEELPVDASLEGNLTDTDIYTLPKGVNAEQVVRAVSGTLRHDEIADLEICWKWEYEVSEMQDMVDTALGNRIEDQDYTVGVWIVVEDGNEYITPDSPDTGVTSTVWLFVVLLSISGLMLIFLIWDRKREETYANR